MRPAAALRLAAWCASALALLAACADGGPTPPPAASPWPTVVRTPTDDASPPPSPTPTTPAPVILPPTTATPIETGGMERPILHMDEEKTGIVTMVVTKASHPDGRERQTVVSAVGATWSPKGDQIAYVSPTGQQMNVANLEGEDRTLINSSGQWRPFYAWPSWSPDGGRIALIEVGWCMDGDRISDVLVVDVASGKHTDRYGPHDFWRADATEDGPRAFSMPEALRWSPDASKLLISWDKAVVLDFATGKIETVSEKRVIAEWAPDSHSVYYFDAQRREDGRVVTSISVKRLGDDEPTTLADAARLSELGIVGEPGPIPALMALSPTGETMALAVGQSYESARLELHDLSGGASLDPAAPTASFPVEGRLLAMDWSPDGGSIAVLAAGADNVTTLRVVDTTTGQWTAVGTPAVETRVVDEIPTVLSWGR